MPTTTVIDGRSPGARSAQRGRTDARTKCAGRPPRGDASRPVRAEALVLLAELESERDSVPLLEEALREAASRPALQSVIHCRLAWASPKPGFDHARKRWSSPTSSTMTCCEDRPAQCKPCSLVRRRGEAPEDLPARVRDFPSAVGGDLLVREATLAVVNTLAPVSKRDEARALLEREYEEWRERDEPRSSRALWGLAWVEFWAGRWALGAEQPLTPATSRSSTGSRCRRTICRVRSSPSTEDNSTWPGSTRNRSHARSRAVPRTPRATHGSPRSRGSVERRSGRGQGMVR